MKQEPYERSRPTRHEKSRHLLALVILIVPCYLGPTILHFLRDQPLSTQQFIYYLAIISPLAIVIAFILLRFLCGEKPKDLNLMSGKLTSDLSATLILAMVIVAANVVTNEVLTLLISDSFTDSGVRNLFADMSVNPWRLTVFLGLLIPLGAASEEVVRAFVLSRLWKVWPSITGKLVAIVISACLFGLSHTYQGLEGTAWTTVLGLIMAFYYFRFGRVVPLVLAHYVTNALYAVIFVVSAR
jgi:membrane protease YdiL (CAAX protease family)